MRGRGTCGASQWDFVFSASSIQLAGCLRQRKDGLNYASAIWANNKLGRECVCAWLGAAYLKALKCRQKVQPEHPSGTGTGSGTGRRKRKQRRRKGWCRLADRQTPDMRRHPTHHSCCFWALIVLSVWQQLHPATMVHGEKQKVKTNILKYIKNKGLKAIK